MDGTYTERICEQNRRFDPSGLVYAGDTRGFTVAVNGICCAEQTRCPDIVAWQNGGYTGANCVAFVQGDVSYFHTGYIGNSVVWTRWNSANADADVAGAGASF